MTDPEWPPFIYDNVTMSEYIEQVVTEKSIPEIKQQIEFLVDFIQKQVQYPFEDRELTFLYVNACCKAIRGLMRYGIPPLTETPEFRGPEETDASCGEVLNPPCDEDE